MKKIAHAIPLFVRSGVLLLSMLYFEYMAILMHDQTRSILIIPDFHVQRSRLSQLLCGVSHKIGTDQCP